MTDTKKLHAIREHLQNLSGLREEPFGNRIRKTVGFEVLDQADLTNSIAALLEVCYYALDGHGSFVEPKHSHKMPIASVTKVIEMVIDLLPHDQMYGLDKITEILADGASKKA